MSTPLEAQLATRAAADPLLRWVQLFARGSHLPVALCLHLELLETAFHLSDERITTLKSHWWVEALRDEAGRRHPLLEALNAQAGPAPRHAVGRALLTLGAATTPVDVDALWAQALTLAAAVADLVGAAPAAIALHGLLWRLRLPLAGPHNAGLCPLALRARHQLPAPLAPKAWPSALRQAWLATLCARWQDARTSPATAADAVLAALLERELAQGMAQPARWRPGDGGRGFGALWAAWRAAVRRR